MSQAATPSVPLEGDAPGGPLAAALAYAAHYLPSQGPISVFVHHNTLHAFQDQPFHTAVRLGQQVFGGEPYPLEADLRQALARGRITAEDLDAVLALEPVSDGNALCGGFLTRSGLRRLLLDFPVQPSGGASVHWHLAERGHGRAFRSDVPHAARDRVVTVTRAWLREAITRESIGTLRSVLGSGTPWSDILAVPTTLAALEVDLERDPTAYALAALWQAALALTAACPPEPATAAGAAVLMPIHRDLVRERTGRDTRDLVNPVLARWVAAYLDQGLAYWPMPGKERGLLGTIRWLYMSHGWASPDWLAGLSHVLERQHAQGHDGAQVVADLLAALGVPPPDHGRYLASLLRGLPGWAGLVHMLERDPTLAPHSCPPVKLMDFAALALTLEQLALTHIARTSAEPVGPLADLMAAGISADGERAAQERAYRFFQVLQLAGVPAPVVRALSAKESAELAREIDRLDDLEVRRLLFLAYERNYRDQVLGALGDEHRRSTPRAVPAPSLQLAFCIDEREESIRRHVEELAPGAETFGIAGFFGVAVAFQGLDDPHPVTLCPVGVEPAHVVKEVPDSRDEAAHASRRSLMRWIYRLAFGIFVGSRAFLRGWIATVLLGALAMVPLTARVFLPRWVARSRHRLSQWLLARPRTALLFERSDPAAAECGRWLGFTIPEMVDGVERTLRAAGLTSRFAPLVFLIGHGSTSLNNPHESAHDCGACGGHRGAPNARLFARFMNHPGVRAGLAERGIAVPDGTWFVGGCHDTCSDALDLFDLDEVPAAFAAPLAEARRVLDEARARNAQERCRRFESAPADGGPAAALAHVESRSEDLSEPRPEYGHATNACAIIGRRELSRSLFLDRRAFLVSYDATQDAQGEILKRLLAALVPVASGISLEYYFSRVDNARYGCGTKLPHNITGLVGIVNGQGGDLLTGLPWQMVEVHEAMRLVAVIEASPDEVGRVVAQIPHVRDAVRNEWIQVACVDPATRAISVLERGAWVPFRRAGHPVPVVPTSRSWYHGRRDFVPVAHVDARVAAGVAR